jgi:hypothetical protein
MRDFRVFFAGTLFGIGLAVLGYLVADQLRGTGLKARLVQNIADTVRPDPEPVTLPPPKAKVEIADSGPKVELPPFEVPKSNESPKPPETSKQPEEPKVAKAPEREPPRYGPNVPIEKRLLPDDNPWNQDISQEPVDPMSARIIARIGANKPLHPEYGAPYRGAPNGIPYVVVKGNQPRVPVEFRYAEESDPGPYPVPPNAPIEGGPNGSGDRHVVVLDRDNWMLYELFNAFPAQGGWRAGSGAIFNLKTNTLRRAGHTSADAAGLPILPGLVRYDEVMVKGEINHALRFTVGRTRRAFVPPATHFASEFDDADLPPMGMRVRLRADYDISGFPKESQVVLRALKKYGMFLADNGADWFISGAPDPRWNDERTHEIKKVMGRDLEVVRIRQVFVP